MASFGSFFRSWKCWKANKKKGGLDLEQHFSSLFSEERLDLGRGEHKKVSFFKKSVLIKYLKSTGLKKCYNLNFCCLSNTIFSIKNHSKIGNQVVLLFKSHVGLKTRIFALVAHHLPSLFGAQFEDVDVLVWKLKMN